MKVIDVIQSSPEWLAARCGIPTSSNFDKIVTTKGTPSKQREKYLYKLAGEKILGIQEETYKNQAMEIGIERESEAREVYELITGLDVKQVGFCLSEGEHQFGASPDGLVGDDGLLEIKCPLLATHVSYLLKGIFPTDYYQQVQGQLFVTGRKWCDFMSYFPSLRPLVIRVYPNPDFALSLEIELTSFCVELDKVLEKIK